MLELMKYVGCCHCEKNGRGFDCCSHSKPVHIKFLQNEVWNNCGHDTVVFTKPTGMRSLKGTKFFVRVQHLHVIM